MPRNDDGEFELILGNKQLLSVFFIVVTLLAVFFAMGFIMGRSVNPVGEARKVDNSPSDRPIIVDAKPSASSGIAARPVEIKSPVEAEVTKPEIKTPEVKLPEPVKPDVKTKAELAKEAKDAAKEAEAKKAELKKAEREKADREKELKAEAKKAEKKTEAKPVSGGAGKPAAGTYLQVSATGKSEADLVSEVLAKKGFKAYVVPHESKPELFRVVVGPVKPGGDQSKTMDELKAAGFKPFARKL